MKPYLLPIFALLIVGCGNRHAKKIVHTEQDSTELTIKTLYDTVHFKFKWRDADSIPYLFGKPSKDNIAEYRRRFDSLHLTERYGFYDRIEYFRDIPHITAVNDFVTLWFATETPYQDDLDMILWRINEYYPLNCSTTETERYQRFSEQIDSLLSYTLGTQWDYNIHAWLAIKLHECKVEFYNYRLLDCNNEFKDILASEHCAWKEYEETLYDVCDKIVVGKHGGSGAPMAYGDFFIESYEQRLISLLDYYFILGDSNYQPTERHRLIPDKMMQKAYSDFYDDLINSDFEDYSVEEKRCALNNDMRFWNKWMAERQKISKQLSLPFKRIYDNCTNNLKRRKLIQLKNQYCEHMAGLPQSTADVLLQQDCSDKELFNYDYQTRYDALLIK